MPKNAGLAEAVLRLLYRNEDTFEPIASLGDASGIGASAGAGSVYVALHTADPGRAAASQSVNEVSTGNWSTYVSQAVARSAGGWDIVAAAGNNGAQVDNAALITFPQKTEAGTVNVLFWSVGNNATSTVSEILHYGALALAVPVPFVVDDASPAAGSDVFFTGSAHGLTGGDSVCFFRAEGQALPAGLTEGAYETVNTVPDTTSFTITGTNVTGVGAGFVARVLPRAVSQDTTLEIPAGNLIIIER